MKYPRFSFRVSEAEAIKFKAICERKSLTASELFRFLVNMEYDRKAEENRVDLLLKNSVEPVARNVVRILELLNGKTGKPAPPPAGFEKKTDHRSAPKTTLDSIISSLKSDPVYSGGFEGEDDVPDAETNERDYQWKSYGQYLAWCKFKGIPPTSAVVMRLRKSLNPKGISEYTGRPEKSEKP